MTKKSSAAAGLTDFVLNITVYWDINEDVEPKRLAAESATNQLNEAVAAKDAALAKKPPSYFSLLRYCTGDATATAFAPSGAGGAIERAVVLE